MSAPPRRNEPCPCGSGRRFKECHGRLDAGAEPSVDALIQRALQLHQQGRVEEAASGYRAILERSPGNAIATHYLGMAAWHRGDLAEAERLMRESIAREASIPDFHNNLALLMRDTRRLDEAIAGFHRALQVDPGWFEAYNNLGLTLEAAGRWDEAIDAYRSAIAREPRFAAARQNLGRALLTMGRLAEGWEQYRWRLLAQGLASAAPDPSAARLPPTLHGRSFALAAEQGVGDVLFFLRFAPELVRRGARLAFRGDARLHGMLARTGLFALGLDHEKGRAPGMEVLFVGDLPWLLAAEDPARLPPALPLEPLADRVQRLRAELSCEAPLVGLAWRAGLVAPGPVRLQSKHIPEERLAAALGARRARYVSVQRLPRAGEHEAVEKALGTTVIDKSEANSDLEEILALMAVLDDYVGVSNFNTHLRAGVGGPMQVLVPFPPEWRWGREGGSPWFPAAKVVRQDASGAWEKESEERVAG